MSDRGVTRTHQYSNDTFSNLGTNALTVGSGSCALRLDYSVSATRE
jgi:hypothetical protein